MASAKLRSVVRFPVRVNIRVRCVRCELPQFLTTVSLLACPGGPLRNHPSAVSDFAQANRRGDSAMVGEYTGPPG